MDTTNLSTSGVAPWSKDAVRRWMRGNLDAYRDRFTGEVDFTRLAESAANAWDQDHEGGPLDDPDHWVWEVAAEFDDA